MTQRFILKAAAVFLIVGAAFDYYLFDAKGYWLKNEKMSLIFAGGASAVVLASVVYGFAHIETPSSVREQRIDSTQVSDLQQIQWRIQDYTVTNGTVPENLATLGEPDVPTAPENRPAYRYEVTAEGFDLCATFAQESTEEMYHGAMAVEEKSYIKNPDNWQHGSGEVCFKRIVNKGTE